MNNTEKNLSFAVVVVFTAILLAVTGLWRHIIDADAVVKDVKRMSGGL